MPGKAIDLLVVDEFAGYYVSTMTDMTPSASTHRTRLAALVNGLLVFGVPTALVLPLYVGAFQTRPAEVSGSSALLELLQFGLALAALSAVTGWRTLVHGRRFVAGQSRGWQGVGEAALCGLVGAILYLAPGIVTKPREAPPYIIVYGGAAAVLGALLGVALYAIARMILDSQDPRLPRKSLP